MLDLKNIAVLLVGGVIIWLIVGDALGSLPEIIIGLLIISIILAIMKFLKD